MCKCVCVRTCACESCENGRTCRNSPSIATRCPCLGPVGGVCGPQLRPWSVLLLRPAEFCALRWIWRREPAAASAAQPYSWENLFWRLRRRAGANLQKRKHHSAEALAQSGLQRNLEKNISKSILICLQSVLTQCGQGAINCVNKYTVNQC